MFRYFMKFIFKFILIILVHFVWTLLFIMFALGVDSFSNFQTAVCFFMTEPLISATLWPFFACTVVATKAWNYGLYCNDSAKYDFCRNDEDFYIITPMMLYLAIDAMPFNYEFDVRDAIGLKY